MVPSSVIEDAAVQEAYNEDVASPLSAQSTPFADSSSTPPPTDRSPLSFVPAGASSPLPSQATSLLASPSAPASASSASVPDPPPLRRSDQVR
ncbi:unnamed protein product [Linum trigynum]|uniref:Uncharacterized protein n=1 Tax=Linum trigynum TaxID=586398 RepID=A0AAV2E270_9ROSI